MTTEQATPVVAIASRKGGTGKTTLALALADYLGTDERPALVIDLDPQGGSTAFLADPSAVHTGLRDRLAGSIENPIPELALPCPERAHVRIVPASPELEFAAGHAAEVGLVDDVAVEFSQALEASDLSGFACVIIDCPPAGNALMRAALLGAEHVAAPIEPGLGSLSGLSTVQKAVAKIQRRRGGLPHIAAAVRLRWAARTRFASELDEALQAELGEALAPVAIPSSVRVPEAQAQRATLAEVYPREAVTEATREACAWVAGRVGLEVQR